MRFAGLFCLRGGFRPIIRVGEVPGSNPGAAIKAPQMRGVLLDLILGALGRGAVTAQSTAPLGRGYSSALLLSPRRETPSAEARSGEFDKTKLGSCAKRILADA
jgi:hypothetical protein